MSEVQNKFDLQDLRNEPFLQSLYDDLEQMNLLVSDYKNLKFGLIWEEPEVEDGETCTTYFEVFFSYLISFNGGWVYIDEEVFRSIKSEGDERKDDLIFNLKNEIEDKLPFYSHDNKAIKTSKDILNYILVSDEKKQIENAIACSESNKTKIKI
jgi:hypothetical protein